MLFLCLWTVSRLELHAWGPCFIAFVSVILRRSSSLCVQDLERHSSRISLAAGSWKSTREQLAPNAGQKRLCSPHGDEHAWWDHLETPHTHNRLSRGQTDDRSRSWRLPNGMPARCITHHPTGINDERHRHANTCHSESHPSGGDPCVLQA